MGLDWIVKPKAKDGYKDQFIKLNEEIYELENIKTSNDSEKKKGISEQIDFLNKKLKEISVQVYETAQTYIIGSNPEKDLEIFKKEIEKDIGNVPEYTFEKFLEKNNGKLYTSMSINDSIGNNGSFLVSDFDFRGKIISRSEHFSDELQNMCYSDMEPEDMFILANKIQNELTNVDKSDDMYPTYLHAINWLRFWASNGHGIHAWY